MSSYQILYGLIYYFTLTKTINPAQSNHWSTPMYTIFSSLSQEGTNKILHILNYHNASTFKLFEMPLITNVLTIVL